jgi:hypothetical protein
VIIGGSSGSQIVQANCFLGLFSSVCDTTEADVQLPLPHGGTISNFAYQGGTGASFPDTLTLRVNGVNTSITCTTNSSFGCTDSTHTAAVNAGDKITVDASGNTGKPGAWLAQLN